jgi:hypothetical protein
MICKLLQSWPDYLLSAYWHTLWTAENLPRRTEDVSFTTLSFTRGTMGLILLIIVVLLVLGALPTWPYSTGWGYYPSGGLGLILLILIVLLLMGRL